MSESRLYSVSHDTGEAKIGPVLAEGTHPIELTEAELQQMLSEYQFPLDIDTENMPIIAYGDHSVAVRLTTKTGESWIGVLRYTKESDNNQESAVEPKIGPEIRSKELSDKIISELEGFAVPRMHLIMADHKGRPMTLRLSQEEQGDTLHDVDTLHLLGNPEVLSSYADLCWKMMRVFLKGQSFDVTGKGGMAKFMPWASKNVLITPGSEIKVIDVEVLGEHDPAQDDSLKDTAKRNMKVGVFSLSTIFSGLVAAGMNHLLRSTRYSTEAKQRDNSPEMVESTQSFQEIIEQIESLDVEYRIVGGFAFAAYLQQQGLDYQLSAIRQDGSKRDVDVFVFAHRTPEIDELERSINERAKENDEALEISVQCLDDEREFSGRTITKRTEDGSFRLIFDDLEQELNKEDFAAVNIEYQKVPFETLPLEVLIGLTLTRQGAIPFVDLIKVAMCYQGKNNLQVPDSYMQMAQKIRTQKPWLYKKWQIKQWLNLLTGNGYDRMRAN